MKHMKSKKLISQKIQKKLDAGLTQKEFAKEMGLNPNIVSMLLSDNYDTTLSLNRLPRLAEVCDLNGKEVIQIALARVADAGGNPIEINKGTLVWLFKTLYNVAAAHRRTVAGSGGSA